jgi:pyroglutamyl-peptidase
MISVLLTGFGPFPGAPRNPTGALVRTLTRLRRPALHDVRLAAHVFMTSYAAVDRDLPALIARHKPDVLLMFGLAARSKTVRIETRARNALAAFPDAGGLLPRRHTIAPNAGHRVMSARRAHLLTAARATRVPVRLSRDAGRYLCNYLYWRALNAADTPQGPRLAVFVHIPQVAATVRPKHIRDDKPHRHSKQSKLTMDDLVRVADRILMTLVAAARRV